MPITSQPSPNSAPPELVRDLKSHLALCEEVMALAARENQALCGSSGYEPFEFYNQRKKLLPRLDQSLAALRGWRAVWQSMAGVERFASAEVGSLFQAAQGLMMRLLLLDRENQQALLRRGLMPARHLPAPAAQQPHCVADLYRRHARTGGV